MNRINLFRAFQLLLLGLWLVPTGLRAANSVESFSTNFANLFGLSSNLTINLKAITGTDGDNTTLGLQYSYERHIFTNLISSNSTGFRNRYLDLGLRSEGLITLEARKSPNRLLTHGLRLSLENLWPNTHLTGERSDQARKIAGDIARFRTQWLIQRDTWLENKNSFAGAEAYTNMALQVRAAETYLGGQNFTDYTDVEPDEEGGLWYVRNAKGHRVRDRDITIKDTVYSSPFYLAWDLDADAETDQTFDDIQLVGGTQIRAFFKRDWFDKPFQWIRGYEVPRDFRNRNNGPYLYGGVSIVDASNNDSREAITGGEDDVFGRAHFGVGFRAELYQITAKEVLSVELQWRYYHEFDAPASIRRADLDNTSYFRATLLLPYNYFLEYTDGKLPIDVEGASTVSVGWRHNF
jgi:hypothetical protein